MNNEIKIGQVYRHYKGNHYEVMLIGKHSESGEELVGYRRKEDGHVYFRPKAMFFDPIEFNGVKTTRFVLVSDSNKAYRIFTEIFGWYGAVAIVGTFAAHSLGYMEAGLLYHVLNATGAFGISLVAFTKKTYQPAVLNLIWVVIAVVAIINLFT